MKTMIVMTMIMTTMMTLKPKHPRGRDRRPGALAQAITQTPNPRLDPRPQAKTPPLRCRRSRKGVLAQAKPQTLNPKVLKPKHPRGRDRRKGVLAHGNHPNPKP